MNLDVLFVGTAGSAPTARRGLPATLIRRGGDRLLFDCGEGTQRQLVRSIGLIELGEIFITHFHADHVLGLPGLLKTFSLRGRERPLTVYGPPGLKGLFAGLSADHRQDHVRGPARGGRRQRGAASRRLPDRRVRGPPQRQDARLRADRGLRPGHFDPARAEELGVKPGPDFGRLQRGETVNGVSPEQVMGERRRGRKLVLAGDSAPCEMTEVVAHEADLLVHEATFADEDAHRAAETRHSTARQAAKIAAAANVAMLALTHVSPRYGGGELRDEARSVFPQTIVPRDFDRVDIPFPERGGPVHVKASDKPPEPEAEREPAVP